MKKDFNKLINTFKSSIKTWDYFVNWEKVFSSKEELEIILNKLNYLLGKEDLKKEFKRLYDSNPDIVKALPILLAVREKEIELFDNKTKKSEFFNFSKLDNNFEKYYKFLENTGLVKLFQKDGIKNLVDYVIGVEVGLDSNGRKNRGGKIMEKVVESFIKDFSKKNNLEYLSQVTPSMIKKNWGVNIKINKSERNFDFAIYNKNNGKIKIIETNFYNGGGSKLKAVCGEFKNLHKEIVKQGVDFIWITDGNGWKTAKKPLEEVYNHK
ncbi:MAG: type II site-specific deoxyribonuclease [Parcubacteria bacterium 33_209]|nr:MAG: type II site-specific deoxyribonuclease [Parcubacteria bacterium 33_209]